MPITYKKYYKGFFLGLVDLAIINSYIIYNAVRTAANLQKMSHVKFLKHLHLELCQLHDEDWAPLRSTRAYNLRHEKSWRLLDVGLLSIFHCKMMRGDQATTIKGESAVPASTKFGTDNDRGGASSTYCSKCKLKTASKKTMSWRVFLCQKNRHTVKGELLSYFDIWHRAWRQCQHARSIHARGPAWNEEDEKGGESDEEARDESKTSSVPP
ncbi:LOW QUALITY PROTEIN: Hypothetical protein PHPALM_36853 [Phytophthora palmivora]|uniref:PiggyBac transposable element-derived protein domain-containing protein n=1 Tax=Phytophthora palmivora TaxID=4796 RepID=A0A2P4WYW9_9STRA|nr:LOW QUALITY PROTEIN: Hypothetical protein PHPALM_36853 [Phytophthora palmivora]